MQVGVVKWFDNRRGIGFLLNPEGGAGIFVHHTAIEMDGFRTLAEGQVVLYELAAESPRGPSAVRVVPEVGRGEERRP